MSRRTIDFQSIRSEGGLLPADLLRRVIDAKSKLEGLRPEDYGLPAGERLNEVITQSWNRLRKHWTEFRAAAASLPVGEPGTGLTNDKWNLPLLRELGFGPLPTTAGPEIAGRTYAINRFCGPVPIHLIGCGLSLDRRAAGVRGAAASNPHGLVQEFLNRSSGHVWAIVSNGLRLRILRDNQALSRQSFLEFDLETLFAGELYSDFVLLWLLAHATRFAPQDADRPDSCWLERWTKLAQEEGTRALTDLRGGVEKALQVLGQGFVSHPKNIALREALRTGEVKLSDFHGQLLRVVYRLIFLFVAEDRSLEGISLLHPQDKSELARNARERYAAHYSSSRLRDLASEIKGSRHGDLWRQFQLIVGALSGDERFAPMREALALPSLGSMLWNPDSTTILNGPGLSNHQPSTISHQPSAGAELTNFDFLEALRLLAFTRQGKVLRPVDYKNLGSEEFGGVYESFLALTPQISSDGARFTFAQFAGNERKTSGSYYTPDSLVQCLLDSALDPVVEEKIKGKTGAEAEKALLSLKVCDKAVGSGHFLVGAAHRLARHLARIRAVAVGESEPSPVLYQTALRDVIGHCLYGVDINPMSVELCKVTLWLEALEPGKPLSFLDHHIRCGNSLLGATPDLVANGIPDDAFKPIEGDDKQACSELKKRNSRERQGLGELFAQEDTVVMESLQQAAGAIDELPDDSPEAVHRKEDAFREAQSNYNYLSRKTLFDTWCASFVIRKHFGEDGTQLVGITQRHLNDLASGGLLPEQLRRDVNRLAGQYQFFHWYLEFPEVFAQGGFDVSLGNPPWDKIQPEEEKFFSSLRPDIAEASSAKIRKALIEALPRDDPRTHTVWRDYKRRIDGTCHFLRSSGALRFTGDGNLNSYRIFTELASKFITQRGRAGLVAQSGLATDESGKELFDYLLSTGRLCRFLDFENRGEFFVDVHQQFRFCLITIQGSAGIVGSSSAEFGWLLHRLEELGEPGRLVRLTADDMLLFNPSSRTCPVFTSVQDVEVSRCIYEHGEHVMLDESRRYERIDFLGELFNMTRDSAIFLKEPHEVSLPLYEAKFIHQFDHRFATTSGGDVSDLSEAEKREAERSIVPKSFVNAKIVRERTTKRGICTNWLCGFRSIASPTNEHTSIVAVFPFSAVGNSINLILGLTAPQALVFMANANSFVFDFCARQKISGSNVNIWIFKQLPVLPPAAYAEPCGWARQPTVTHRDWLLPRVLELTYTAWDLEPFAQDCGWSGPPFRWDEKRRFLLRCELDAAFFHLYLGSEDEWRKQPAALTNVFPTPREAVSYIMDTFPIVKRKDEAAHGTYRTKDTILEIYDALQASISTGIPYQTRLDPPPANPECCHSPRAIIHNPSDH